MKKSFAALLIIAFIAIPTFALSGSYQPVRVEVGGIFPMGFGDPVQKGFGWVVEPKVNLTDKFSVGLRYEFDLTMGGDSDENSASIAATVVQSYQIKSDYYFTTERVRPFAGVGIGLNSVGAGGLSASDDNASAKAIDGMYFGFTPQAGLNVGNFRLGLSCNMIFAKEYAATTNVETTTLKEETKLLPMLSLEIGGTIGGKKK